LIEEIKQFVVDRRWLPKLFGLILALLLIFLLASQIEPEEAVEVIQEINPYMVLLGFFVYLGGIFFRAIRFRIVLNNKELRYCDLFTIVAVSNLINNILPARTGELSYIYLSKKLIKVPLKHGTASLIVARIFDVISISLLLLLSILCLYTKYLLPYQTQILIVIFLFLFISILALIAIFNGKFSVIIAKTSTLLKIRKFNFISRILNVLYEMEENLINIYSKKIFIQLLLISLISSSTSFITYLLILQNLMEIGVCAMAFITLFTRVTLTLPIHSFAGFGTYEGAWVIASMALGIPIDIAVLSSFTAHIIGLLYTIGAGIFTIAISKEIQVNFLTNRKL
jgi:uncharacterized protein (TIRG00374 family)